MEEHDAAGVPTAHQAGRFADCRRLSCRNQYASSTPGAFGRVWRAISKDTVSRVWRKVKGDWDAWNARSLAEEPIIRLILDGTVVRVRLDRKATSIVLLVPGGKFQDCGRKPPSRRPCAQLGKRESGYQAPTVVRWVTVSRGGARKVW